MRCGRFCVAKPHEFCAENLCGKAERDRKLALRDIFAEEPFLQTALSFTMFCTKLKRSLHTNTPSGKMMNHLMWDLLIISTQSLYDIYSHLKLYHYFNLILLNDFYAAAMTCIVMPKNARMFRTLYCCIALSVHFWASCMLLFFRCWRYLQFDYTHIYIGIF